MTNCLRKYEDQITKVIDESLRSVFTEYFNLEIDLDKFSAGGNLKDAITSRTMISDKDAGGIILLSIERDMLIQLSKKIFPEDVAITEPAIHSCINEITNIVCTRVKGHFSDFGYNLTMEIPSVVSDEEKRRDNIEILFSVEENKLLVDIGMKKPAGTKTAAV